MKKLLIICVVFTINIFIQCDSIAQKHCYDLNGTAARRCTLYYGGKDPDGGIRKEKVEVLATQNAQTVLNNMKTKWDIEGYESGPVEERPMNSGTYEWCITKTNGKSPAKDLGFTPGFSRRDHGFRKTSHVFHPRTRFSLLPTETSVPRTPLFISIQILKMSLMGDIIELEIGMENAASIFVNIPTGGISSQSQLYQQILSALQNSGFTAGLGMYNYLDEFLLPSVFISGNSSGNNLLGIHVNINNSRMFTQAIEFLSETPCEGGGLQANCNYFFANNTVCASEAPSQPIFWWEDTNGSTSLVVNNIQAAASIFNGSLDNGHWKLGNILTPGDKFRFCGVDYDSFFVSTNGLIALTRTGNTDAQINAFTTTNIPNNAIVKPALFPFWKDFRFDAAVVNVNRISYKVVPGKLIITYDRAPNFGATLATDYVSFQVILETAPGGGIADGNIIAQYDDSRTGAEFLNKYFNFNLAGHTVGIQDVTGTLGIQYRRVTGTGTTSVLVTGPLFASPIVVAFGPNQNVLPVELASFTSTINRRDVTLNWTTQTESNNSGFEIHRSIVNSKWSIVGFVNGNGTTTSPINYSFTDRGLNTGKYNYRLKQIDLNGNFKYFNLSNEVGIGIPTRYDLSQNYPNPFNPTTKINYDLPYDGKVSIKLFDMSGREVAILVNDIKPAGYYAIDFSSSNLASGAYFYRIIVDANGQKFVASKKMVILK